MDAIRLNHLVKKYGPAVAVEDLARLAPAAAEQTFNSISVEGHTSTNDSLLFFANGQGPRLTGEALAGADAADPAPPSPPLAAPISGALVAVPVGSVEGAAASADSGPAGAPAVIRAITWPTVTVAVVEDEPKVTDEVVPESLAVEDTKVVIVEV